MGVTFVQTWVYRERRKPVSVPYNNIPEANGTVRVTNIRGLKNLRITVNGHKFQVAGLKDQEVTIDVSSAMEPGDKNMIVLTALGKPGTSAMVEIGPVSP